MPDFLKTDKPPMPWLLLRSGAAYDYDSEDCPGLNFVLDVVVPLSRITRYLGHTDTPWSVAAHAVLCAQIAKAAGEPLDIQLECLHHDDAEALVGDCPTPVKRLLAGEFEKLEDKAHTAIMNAANRAGYRYRLPQTENYRRYDRCALMAERGVLKVPTPPGRTWGYNMTDEDWYLIKDAMPTVSFVIGDNEHWGSGAEASYLMTLRQLEMKL